MWVLAGLICNTISCQWTVPAFDSESYFVTRRECEEALTHVNPYGVRYFVVECRKTDGRMQSRRME